MPAAQSYQERPDLSSAECATALGSPYKAFCEASLALSEHSLLQPDVIVAIGGTDSRYYEIDDLAIVIEVADSTAARDLGLKCAMYAAQAVSEYWVVALPTGEVHQFWEPGVDGFAARRTVPFEGELTSATMPELTIDGRGIL
ncbi:Uma2 family endonuclease [Sphingomonas glacialis]|uniref:Uma2 family endonuclease n=1 Tax=Sphingomonas glacialis TaxID=658225 RepID=UPI00240D1954|nr:Uma2 family endonuclease [Sphingomonas glacialis]